MLFHNLADEFSNEILQTPNYPLAIRSGNGENLHYHLTGGISGSIKNKFPFSARVNYNLDKYFGLTIPKTEQEIIDYSGTFELGYKLKNHHLFGILKLEKEQNNFDYSSAGNTVTPIYSLAFPEYYAGFSVGYGDVLGYNEVLLKGIIDTESKTFGAGYNLSFDNHFITAKYSFTDSTERYYATSYLDEDNLASMFNREENILEILYLNQFKNQKLIIDGSLYYGKGTNTHAFEGFTSNSENLIVKTNYQKEVTQGKLNVYWEKRKNNQTQIGINFQNLFEENTRIDLNTTNQKTIALQSKLLGNKDITITSKSILNIEAGFSYYFPISNTLTYTSSNSSTSEGSIIPPRNTFGEDVIAYDYAFDTVQKFGSTLGLVYQTEMKKNRIATIALNYNYLTTLEKTNFSNTNNQTLSLSLNLKY